MLPVSEVRQEPDVFEVPFTPVTNAFKGRVLDISPAIGTSTSNAFNLLSSDTEPGVYSEAPHEGSGSDREDLDFNGDETALSLVKGRERLYLNHYSSSSSSGKKQKKKRRSVS